ncbi:MAG: enoyl-CoA hydratase [Sandaracinaceae bacterium]|nr:MAG: enoyl-CoA hydratase [Sandaracinaceae bacterium]
MSAGALTSPPARPRPVTRVRLAPTLTARGVGALGRQLQGVRSAAVVLEGDADVFCRGLDLEGPLDDGRSRVAAFTDILEWLDRAPFVVIALVRGAAQGGGLGLASVADHVLAGPGASFGLPELLFGLMPAAVHPYVARRIGPSQARRLALGGPTLTASEAARLGLVDQRFEDDGEAALAALLQRTTRLGPAAVARFRAYSAGFAPPDRASAIDGFESCATSEDARVRLGRWRDGWTPWPLPDEERPS